MFVIVIRLLIFVVTKIITSYFLSIYIICKVELAPLYRALKLHNIYLLSISTSKYGVVVLKSKKN